MAYFIAPDRALLTNLKVGALLKSQIRNELPYPYLLSDFLYVFLENILSSSMP
jgi:hypothetical protein